MDPVHRYHDIPYQSWPQSYTHPDHLASLASFLGMTASPVDHSRVLEIGCAGGGNLIPMATTFPEASFVGIEVHPPHAEQAQSLIRELGLKNIEIRNASLLDVDAGLGLFDYLIVHGVFSWVSAVHQEKIFQIAKQNLSPNGVAYISYNCYPGWHQQAMLRDIMRFHSRRFEGPEQQLKQSREILDILSHWVPADSEPYGGMLQVGSQEMRSKPDWSLYHDHLGPINDPLHFYEFLERAGRHELRFLGEADTGWLSIEHLPEPLQAKLQELAPTRELLEQYADFLRNRAFRRTLLVHADVNLDREPQPNRLAAFYLSLGMTPITQPEQLESGQPLEFANARGQTIGTRTPLIKAALLLLSEVWPGSIHCSELYARANQLLGLTDTTSLKDALQAEQIDAIEFIDVIYRAAVNRLLDFSINPSRFTTDVGERPSLSVLARHQAKEGKYVTNELHETVELDEMDRYLAPLLDGTRDVEGLNDQLCRLIADGTLKARTDGELVTDPQRQREMVRSLVEQKLPEFARRALLVR